uniref:Uncharacterized protein n=1 Tax=Ananas comosus var. bracteatus TaxID=296719 RepID=A0A6V7PU15_ANACO|nr:unnamed protein product [Ananas comosus var. bracteatus]
MQSSPVFMLLLVTMTSLDIWMWMPSVLGLLPSAVIFAPCTVTPLLPKMEMWKPSLFTVDSPLMRMLFDSAISHNGFQRMATKNTYKYEHGIWEKKYTSFWGYSNSKLAQVKFNSIICKRIPTEAGINVLCVSPGIVHTNV